MTAPHIVDPAGLLGEALAEASPDLMRSLLQSIINALLSADADAVVGAEWGRPTPGRASRRKGYRHRDLDTRVGTIDVAIPKLRKGTYFPEWLLERRKRSESALITVVADCYLAGVSARRMDKLVKTLGIDSLSKSQVSRMAADLDATVEDFRHRPLSIAEFHSHADERAFVRPRATPRSGRCRCAPLSFGAQGSSDCSSAATTTRYGEGGPGSSSRSS